MVETASSVLRTNRARQLAFNVIYGLTLTAWRYPPPCTLTNGTYYDFIIIGGGSAGSILVNRLSANSSYSVLLIEAGGYAPLESEMPGLFPILTKSIYDYNLTSVNDNRTAQNLRNNVVELTAGMMLGGSSALDHTLYVVGDKHDYDNWANILNDPSWNYTNILKYMKKQENLTDPDLLHSKYGRLHGADGPLKIRRYTKPENAFILAAAVELGHRYVEDTTSDNSSLGITQPLFTVDDQVRQSNSIKYLGAAKERPNLCMVLHTTATKILFHNTTAIGVQVIDSIGNVYVLYVKKEVIVSAGALNSPKLLMLSGVGPSSHLKSLNIPVVADLPVGENLQDHPSAIMVYQMEEDNSTTPPMNFYEMPLVATCLYGAIDSKQLYPDYQAIIVTLPHDSTIMTQLSSIAFKYNSCVCNKWYAANSGRKAIYVILNLMIPKSRGKLLLSSANYSDSPLVHLGTYSDKAGADLDLMTESLLAIDKFRTTTHFKSVNASFVDPGVCCGYTGREYWRCYALAMSATTWHYAGTCKMGSVVDTKLRVKGLRNLRVIDASVMPTLVSGNIKPAVNMVAERGASLILSEWK